MLLPSVAGAAVVFDGSPGTAPPPATLGGYPMTPFAADPRPLFEDVLSVPSPLGGDVAFDRQMNHRRVGEGWHSSWSHGYTGDVYFSDVEQTRTLTLPEYTRAFYFYVQLNRFGTGTVTASAQDGTTSGPVTVRTSPPGGPDGAKFIGFYATGSDVLSNITVSSGHGRVGIALGELGIGMVRYTFGGFRPPIDAEDTNTVTAGRTVPVSYTLTDRGAPVSDPSHFVAMTSHGAGGECGGDPADATESSPGRAGLRYLGEGRWKLLWKTPKSYAGQCRLLRLHFDDGSTYDASFVFRGKRGGGQQRAKGLRPAGKPGSRK